MSVPSSPEDFRFPSADELSSLFQGYRISEMIAAGGMGAVYLAEQLSLSRWVALKVLPVGSADDADFRKRFEAEAKAMARLNHPNLVGVFDSGEAGGMPFIVMEYVPGGSLHEAAGGRPIDPGEVVRIVSSMCKGLAHAHENGILHRDIKPSNILMTAEAEPKIGDFGLASRTDVRTQAGEVIYGTPDYSAPEVVLHPDQVDHRADIFAIGVLIHELLTGRPPSADPRPASMICACSPAFDRIIRKATDPSPQARHASVREIAAELQAIPLGKASPSGTRTIPRAPGRKGSIPHPQRSMAQAPAKRRKSGGLAWFMIACIAAIGVYICFPKRKQVVIGNQGGEVPKIVQPQNPSPADSIPAPQTGSSTLDRTGFPIGLWSPVSMRHNLTTIKADGTCENLHGDTGTWGLSGTLQSGQVEIRWASGHIDTLPCSGDENHLSGRNNRDQEVKFEKVKNQAPVELKRFTGDWVGSPEDRSLWRIEPDGKARILTFRNSTRTGAHEISTHPWKPGPNGNQITLFWDSVRRYYNVLTLDETAGTISGVNQRGGTYPLIPAPGRGPNGLCTVIAPVDSEWTGSWCIDDGKPVAISAKLVEISETACVLEMNSGDTSWTCRGSASGNGIYRLRLIVLEGSNGFYSGVQGIILPGGESLRIEATGMLARPDSPPRAVKIQCVLFRSRPKKMPEDALVFGGRRFALLRDACSWPEALERCIRMGGRLAVIPDQETHQFISRLVRGDECWIGATDEAAEGIWRWVDGTPLNFRAFPPGEPNDNGGEDHLVMTSGTWNDRPSPYHRVRGYVCEWPESSANRANKAQLPEASPDRNPAIDEWRMRALKDFPALADPRSKISIQLAQMRRHKEAITPSFFKIPSWPHQLALEAAIALHEESPRYLDARTPVFRGGFYKVIDRRCTWQDAAQLCRMMRGRLVTVPDQETHDFLVGLAGGKDLWLGASESRVEGQWVWTDNTPLTFTKMGRGEGNNHGKDEDYMGLIRGTDWGDFSEQDTLPGFICEWWKARE